MCPYMLGAPQAEVFCLFQMPGWKLKGTELAVEDPRLWKDLPEKSGQLRQWSPLSPFWKHTRIREPFLILLVFYFLIKLFFFIHCISHYAPNSFFNPFSFKTQWFYDFGFILLPCKACCNVDFEMGLMLLLLLLLLIMSVEIVLIYCTWYCSAAYSQINVQVSTNQVTFSQIY